MDSPSLQEPKSRQTGFPCSQDAVATATHGRSCRHSSSRRPDRRGFRRDSVCTRRESSERSAHGERNTQYGPARCRKRQAFIGEFA